MYGIDSKSFEKESLKVIKRDKLRYSEYYNMQEVQSRLYKQSKNGGNFKVLFSLIISDENLLLAYRNIKRNKGSNTAGTNGHTIEYWENRTIEEYLNYMKARLTNYQPQTVRQHDIPKANGKMRTLGIPNIEDRLIQQSIKQILEPICEAKFHNRSYGFRPLRSTEHAIAYVYRKINIDNCYYVVDIDIKGFFDHINHGKLLKQIWQLGIRDKKVISIISAMLKAKVKGNDEAPTEGTPQGGILSPLLSNIVLNELDWWISNQWESYNTRNDFNGSNSHKFRHLRNKSNLKELYIVRYADDFKIFCKSKDHAQRIYHAVKLWLKDRLKLEINEEKSSITDVRKKATKFLGFEIQARKKGTKRVVISHMTKNAKQEARKAIKNQIEKVGRMATKSNIYVLNRLIASLQNYYQLATHISQDFSEIQYRLSTYIPHKLQNVVTDTGTKSEEYQKRYAHYGGKVIYIQETAMYPISYVQTKPPRMNNKILNIYDKETVMEIHNNLSPQYQEVFRWLIKHPLQNKSVELNDNRLSLFSAQKGKCAVSKLALTDSMELHHVLPKSQGGNDRYQNLILVTYEIHKLIHSTEKRTIKKYLKLLKLKKEMLTKLNDYRKIVGNEIITNDL